MDPILYWNEVSLEANRVSHTNGKNEQTGPAPSSRALAIVHLAMYDAFAGVSGNPPSLPPYLTGLPAPAAGASVDAAVAAAAHATLSKLFSTQKPFFDLKHAQAGLQDPGLNEGHAFGLLVAQKMLDDRKNDPSASDDGHAASMARGAHRPDPDNPDQGYHAPFYGAKSKGFAISNRWELLAPPQLGTPDYTRAFRQVRGRGIAPELMGTVPSSSRRTVDQTLIGIYWGYDGAAGLGTPPRLYNQIVREVALNKPNPNTGNPNTAAENARLFALVNVAMADAGILAWDQKYVHDLWRPVVGIREHDASMGPTGLGNNNIDNDCHSLWLPLGAPNTNSMAKNFTPPFPAYPSGHATFGAAAFHITRLFYGVAAGDRNPDSLFNNLTFVSEELNGINKDNKGTVRPKHVRNFPNGLWQMIEENGLSRVYLGVHWVFDAFAIDSNGNADLNQNVGGVPLGITIAEDIFSNGMTKSAVGPRLLIGDLTMSNKDSSEVILEKDTSEEVQRVVSSDVTYREAVAKAMRQVASKNGFTVNTHELIMASHEAVTATLVPITGVTVDRVNTLLSLIFVSQPSYACAESLPTGFYTTEFSENKDPHRQGIAGTVIYRNMDGKKVLSAELNASDIPHRIPSVGVKLVVSEGRNTQTVDILQLWRVKPPGAHHTLDITNGTCLPPGG
jgi:Vanadium chloroperoxidase N-terminal domain/PAP2 superfamily